MPFLVLAVFFAMAACSGGTKKNTLLIYLCGSNLETYNGYASSNLQEMLEAKIPSNTTVIIEVGGSKGWKMEGISSDHTEIYTIKKNKLVLLEQHQLSNMGSADTLRDFIDFGINYAPSDNVSLILWDHGGGTVNGVCADSNFEYDTLSYAEIDQALGESKVDRFEFVGMDACLMATYSFAEMMSKYAEYYIASEELIPGTGWDYKTVLQSVGSKTIYDDILSSYQQKHSQKNTYTLSVIDLSQIDKVRSVVDDISDRINEDRTLVKEVLANGKEFGTGKTSDQGTGMYDLGLLAQSIGVQHDFSTFVRTENGNAHLDATGISIYFPTEEQGNVEEFVGFCPNESYRHFLIEYCSYCPEETIDFVHRGYNNEGRMSFVLSEKSADYVKSVGYELHSYSGVEQTQKLYCVGTDTDVTYENGIYTVDFQGNWVFVNDILLHTKVYAEDENHAIFSSPVLINNELCYLLFTYFKPEQRSDIEGYVVVGDITSRVHELEDGTEVTILYEDPIPQGDEVYHKEGRIIWGEEILFSVKKLDPGYYQYIPYVIDIYGNIFYGDTATIYFDGTKSIMDSIAAG